MSEKIMVTGGCGYIGSHTVVDLITHGFEVVSIDNFSRSDASILAGVKKITGENIKNYAVDLCDLPAIYKVFEQEGGIVAVIHFAAYKSVPESVAKPLLYYRNNMLSLLNIMKCVQDFGVPYFVFSSSCTVYGQAKNLPVTEDTPLQPATSPYGNTKQIGEAIIRDYAVVHPVAAISLRYFNPIGAHESAYIGEWAFEEAENLVPLITQTASGKRKEFVVFGNDYNTRDGTCIRDYIHVMDIAHAHTKALQYLLKKRNASNYEIFNLGTGKGVTVLEAIQAFEKATGQKLNYRIGPRRVGDVEAIYANNDKAKKYLGWAPERSLEEMLGSAWKWEQQLQKTIKKQ